MKVALCCIGKQENLYIREFAEHYKKLGFSKIFLYDNNLVDGERFEDVIQDLIDEGFVEITDYRGRTVCQLAAYQDCYDKHNGEYDWIAFFDCDEFLELVNHDNIESYLTDSMFDAYDIIHINWKYYDDNDLVRYDPRPLQERFTRVLPKDFKKRDGVVENWHVKSIMRGRLENMKWSSNPHTPNGNAKCCDANGNVTSINLPINMQIPWENAYLKHYGRKTIEEFLTNKVQRGFADGNKDYFNENDPLQDFFQYNTVTDEKLEYASDFLNKDKIDIFICSHKSFTPSVENPCYKVLFTKDDNLSSDTELAQYAAKEVPLRLDDKFFSEQYAYKWVRDNYPLKKYVGFCHYRKYFDFMDKIPNIDDMFKQYDCLCVHPIRFVNNNRGQYSACHNVEDFDLVGQIIRDKFNEYSDTYDNFSKSNTMIPCEMFIMRSEDFKDYSDFIIGVLNEYLDIVGTDINKRIEDNKSKYLKYFSPNNTVEYQYRIGGYLAERLTNVFINKRFKNIGTIGMIMTEKKYKVESVGRKLFH